MYATINVGGEEEDDQGKESMSRLPTANTNTHISYGTISVIGRRRSMEDAVTVSPSLLHLTKPPNDALFTYDFFAVYDGHGAYRVTRKCKERLHHLVADQFDLFGADRWETVLSTSYARLDDEIVLGGYWPTELEESMGPAALVVLVGKEDIVVANSGDSRVVLFSDGAASPLSRDHKVRPDTKEVKVASGGKQSTEKECHKPNVISTPEVSIHKRTKSDAFLIIASDGLWDVISNETACDIVRKCCSGEVASKRVVEGVTDNSASASAAMLVELALARGSKDNISVIVVELQSSILHESC